MPLWTSKHPHLRLSALLLGLLAAGAAVGIDSASAATEPQTEQTERAPGTPTSSQPGSSPTAQTGRGDSGGTMSLTEHWLDITPGTIERKTLVNAEGVKLGDVTGVVRSRETGEIAAVVSMGGFLGIGWLGGEEVAVPLDRMHLQENNVILFSPLTQEDLIEQEGTYRPEAWVALEGDTPIGDLPGVVPSPQPTRTATFGELDADGNGILTRSESHTESALIESWEQFDRNNDDRIDRAEFGQFLESQESGEKSGKSVPEV